MSDTLEIFGQEWTGVTGFKATDDNDQIKTYIRPQGTISISQNGTGIDVSQYASADVAVSGGNDFVVTVSWDSSTSKWTPDKTFAQINEAYNAGKTIALRANAYVDQAVADGEYIYDGGYDDDWFWYYVIEYDNTGAEKEKVHHYTLISTGLRYDGTDTYVAPYGTINITQSGNTDVTNYATANVPAGTAGTPTATKGTVSNHQVAVTPSVVNTTGYITGGTETGTPVTVTAAELASGSKTITQNGTDIDVVGYSTVDVAVPSTDFVVTVSWNSSTSRYEPNKTFSEIQTAYNAGKTIAVVSDEQSADTAVDGEYHTGTNPYFEYWVRKYLDGHSPQTIREIGYHLTSTGISTEDDINYIRPTGNLAITQNGNNIDCANYSTVSVNVSGGSSKNIQVNSGSNSVRTNGYTSTGHSLTVAKTGTYKVSWTAWRSSSQGTMGTNLHRNSTAGTNNQTWTNTYGQHIVLNNQSYTAGDVLTLYATAGSTSRYCWVAGLTIEEQ